MKKAEIPSSSGSSVFVGILVSGLLAALAITVGYFKCQRRSDSKGVRLVSTFSVLCVATVDLIYLLSGSYVHAAGATGVANQWCILQHRAHELKIIA